MQSTYCELQSPATNYPLQSRRSEPHSYRIYSIIYVPTTPIPLIYNTHSSPANALYIHLIGKYILYDIQIALATKQSTSIFCQHPEIQRNSGYISLIRYFENAGTQVLSFSTLVSAAFESSGSVPDVDIQPLFCCISSVCHKAQQNQNYCPLSSTGV